MADFVESANVKSAIRTLTNPIEDVATFNNLVQSVITDNPFGCVSYMTAGENHPAVEKTKESYSAKLIYQDNEAKICGTGTHKFNTVAGFNNGIAALLAAAAVTTAHAGIPAHDSDSDAYSVTLKCHDPSGEIYMVNLTRTRVSLTSYSDEAIRTKVETWADGVQALA
jgi:hypothetical protein